RDSAGRQQGLAGVWTPRRIELHHTRRDSARAGFERDVGHPQYWRSFGTARLGWRATHPSGPLTQDYPANEDSHASFKAFVRTEPPGLLSANLVEWHGREGVSAAGPPHLPG